MRSISDSKSGSTPPPSAPAKLSIGAPPVLACPPPPNGSAPPPNIWPRISPRKASSRIVATVDVAASKAPTRRWASATSRSTPSRSTAGSPLRGFNGRRKLAGVDLSPNGYRGFRPRQRVICRRILTQRHTNNTGGGANTRGHCDMLPARWTSAAARLAALSTTMPEIADRRQDFSGDIPAAVKGAKRNGRLQKQLSLRLSALQRRIRAKKKRPVRTMSNGPLLCFLGRTGAGGLLQLFRTCCKFELRSTLDLKLVRTRSDSN
jgi:hypothetical protein